MRPFSFETQSVFAILKANSANVNLSDTEVSDEKYLYNYMGIPNARQRLSDGVIQQKINGKWVDIFIPNNQ